MINDTKETISKQRNVLLNLIRRHMNELSNYELDLLLDLIKELETKEKESVDEFSSPKSNEVANISAESKNLLSKSSEFASEKNKEENIITNLNRDNVFFYSLDEERKENPDPVEVVKRFVQCWNRQDFREEYYYLSKELQLYPLEEYIANRQLTFYETIKQNKERFPVTQQIKEILSTQVNDDQAIVECYKSERIGPENEIIYYQRYTLKKEDNHWKIARVISRLKYT